MASSLGHNTIEILIKRHASDRRFERFVARLMTAREGVVYVTTSPTGDRGRDAVAELADGAAVICATIQTKNIKQKAKADVDRLAKGSLHVVRLHVCASQELSESSRDEIRAYAIKKLSGCRVEVHGATQIVDYAHRYQELVRSEFGRELDSLEIAERRKRDEDFDRENPVRLLRVALATVFDQDVVTQRDHLLDSLVLTALEEAGQPTTSDQMRKAIAKALHLTDVPVGSYLVASFDRLETSQLIARNVAGWRLTASGSDEAKRLTEAALHRELSGQWAFFELLGDLTPEEEDSPALIKLWSVVQQHLSVMFQNSGLMLVDEIRDILTTQRASPKSSDCLDGIRELLEKINNLGLPPKLNERVTGVVFDMLARPNSDAFIWISELAAKYIVICALGLDPQLQQRIAERVSSWQLIPDTHVLLAYLSSGDDRHEQANQLLKATHRLKASLIFAESVLEESIHHAELAKKRFEEFRIRVQEAQHDFPERKAFDVIDPFDNAYIKGFAYETADKFLVSKWPEYISQFVKLESLRRTLSAELTGAEFPTDDADIIKVGQIYAEHKTANYEEGVGENQTLRLQWDGRLLAMCARRNDAVPTGQRLIILTDSESIRSSFVAQIQPNKRSRTALARPAAIAAAMTLVPGTAVNLQCVRVLLFDELRHAIKNLDGALIRREPKRFLRQGALEECIEEEMLGDKASSASPSGSPTPILR